MLGLAFHPDYATQRPLLRLPDQPGRRHRDPRISTPPAASTARRQDDPHHPASGRRQPQWRLARLRSERRLPLHVDRRRRRRRRSAQQRPGHERAPRQDPAHRRQRRRLSRRRRPGTTPFPADNPFVGQRAGADEIWAYRPAQSLADQLRHATGDLYIGDVGQNTREEIDFQPAGSGGGRNYGWPAGRGHARHARRPARSPPIFEYDHNLGNVVTGGDGLSRGRASRCSARISSSTSARTASGR